MAFMPVSNAFTGRNCAKNRWPSAAMHRAATASFWQKNEVAKRYAIKTGEAIWQARQKCPDLVVLTADYAKYLRYSRMNRRILADFSDQVEPFGLDEAWIDVTGSIGLLGDGRSLADRIRRRTREELGLTCSVGGQLQQDFCQTGQ